MERPDAPRPFRVWRRAPNEGNGMDVVVMEGCYFTNGVVVTSWTDDGEPSSTPVWHSWAQFVRVTFGVGANPAHPEHRDRYLVWLDQEIG